MLVGLIQTADQGNGPVPVRGDGVVVLDQNWQVAWFWNPFDKLDSSRPGPMYFNTGSSWDWIHSNSLALTDDGNLLISSRHLSQVIKVDYSNGKGTGNVIWKMGQGGDFSAITTDPVIWFSGQHDATLVGGQLLLFDNGNVTGASQGQVWGVNERTRVATRLYTFGFDIPSAALGSAQKLLNGNFCFLEGFLNAQSALGAEFAPGNNTPLYSFTANLLTYRSFRTRDLYTRAQ